MIHISHPILRMSRLFLVAVCVFVFAGCEESTRTDKDSYTVDKEATVDANSFAWPDGKQVAVSLSFDDARLSQPDVGLPLLDRYNVKGTFYVLPKGVKPRLEAWKKAVAGGHEIGNHTIVHPCSGNYTWVRGNAIEDYDLDKMAAEIDKANRQIKDMLGVTPMTFAYPCGHTFVGRGIDTRSYVPIVAERFIAGRLAGSGGGNNPLRCDLAQTTGVSMDGIDFERAQTLIEQARTEGRWLILYAHEVGEKAAQTVPAETLEAICKYANDPANGVWIDTVENVSKYVIEQDQGK